MSTKLALRDIEGKEIEQVSLDEKIFDKTVNKAVLYQAVNMYLANIRRGTAATKTRGEVRGGGKKPFRQKGTGRARAGSSRSPVWKGGGTVFGPHPRSYVFNLPDKVKRLSLRSSINAKITSDALFLLNDINLKEAKTKLVAKLLKKLKIADNCICVFNKEEDKNFVRAAKNIRNLTLRASHDVNAYEILSNSKMIATKSAMDNLVLRIKGINKVAKQKAEKK